MKERFKDKGRLNLSSALSASGAGTPHEKCPGIVQVKAAEFSLEVTTVSTCEQNH